MSAGPARPTRTSPFGAHDAAQPRAAGEPAAAAGIRDAQVLSALLRGRNLAVVHDFTDGLTRPRLLALAIAACSMLPVGFDPEARLEWIETPPSEWSDRVLSAEARRFDLGDRDATARLAVEETARRLAAMQDRAS